MAGEGLGITSRVAQVTLANWAKKISDQAKQRYILLSILAKKGRIRGGKNGAELRWPVQKKYHDMTTHIDDQGLNFPRVNTLDNANLRWGGYKLTDAITLQEKLENGGDEAVVKIFANRAALMQKAAIRRFGDKFYVDGDAADREMHGIESMMSIDTQTATDALATTCNDTYAGLSTSYTSFTSTTTDPGYKGWSPVIVNSNRQDSGGATLAWADYADEYIRKGLLEACYGNAAEDMVDLVVLKRGSFESFLNLLADKERVNLMSGGEANAVHGFEHTRYVRFDGANVGFDHGVPDADSQSGTDTVHGYGFNTDQMELCLLSNGGKGESIFQVETNYDPFRQADLITLYCLGNFKFESPRHFVKWAELS